MLRLQDIDLDVLQGLIDDKVFEGDELEYKAFEFPEGKITKEQKKTLLKEVVGFTNKNGGIIVIGMKEDEDRLPVELVGTKISFRYLLKSAICNLNRLFP